MVASSGADKENLCVAHLVLLLVVYLADWMAVKKAQKDWKTVVCSVACLAFSRVVCSVAC